jgi:hypothetical protein
MAALRLAPGRAVLTEDVGDLQGGPPHGGRPHDEGGNSSSGPITSRSRSVATWA